MNQKKKSVPEHSENAPSPGGDAGGVDVWAFINDKLSVSIDVMLLYVVDSEGSSPGRRGFKMAVAADGDMKGTIGGGIMEYKFVERSKSILQSGKKEIIVEKQFHDKTHATDQSGMICSGSQVIVLMPLSASGTKEVIQQIVEAGKENKNKAIHLSPAGIKVIDEPAGGFAHQTENDWSYTEAINQQPVIHIIGGGHVALALSELMHFLGFYIRLYDDRTELNTIEQNSFADEKKLVDYATIGDTIDAGADDFVVIMTVGYRTDKLVLKQLLHKKFFYFGLLGSEKKNKKLFTELVQEGIDENKLARIFAPVGLNIYSKTAKEIAVSIAAQIILEKNKNLPTGRTL